MVVNDVVGATAGTAVSTVTTNQEVSGFDPRRGLALWNFWEPQLSLKHSVEAPAEHATLNAGEVLIENRLADRR